MEALLYRRKLQRMFARCRTHGIGLGRPAWPYDIGLLRRAGRTSFGLAAAFTLLFAALEPAAAQSVKRGEALLIRNCASCHAIGRTGESPHKSAPAFRTLGERYPIESLEEALGEGIMSGHPDMPEFSFDAGEVGDIIAYLKSIQQR